MVALLQLCNFMVLESNSLLKRANVALNPDVSGPHAFQLRCQSLKLLLHRLSFSLRCSHSRGLLAQNKI